MTQVETIVKDSDLLKSEKHKVNIKAFLPYMDKDDVRKPALKAFATYLPCMGLCIEKSHPL